jgi:iron complex outermembrane receptor protein
VVVPTTGPNGEPEFLFNFNNVPKASTRGAEIELNWHVSPALTLSGGLGLLRTKIIDSGGALAGREFQSSPHHSASVAVDWTATKRLRVSAQLRYHSSYFSDDFDTPDLRVGRAAIVNARAAYSLRKFTIFAYARNVFNSFHPNLWVQTNPDIVEAEDSRMLGVGLEARF